MSQLVFVLPALLLVSPSVLQVSRELAFVFRRTLK